MALGTCKHALFLGFSQLSHTDLLEFELLSEAKHRKLYLRGKVSMLPPHTLATAFSGQLLVTNPAKSGAVALATYNI